MPNQKAKENIRKFWVYYHPQFGGEIFAGYTKKEAEESRNHELSDLDFDNTGIDEFGELRKVKMDINSLVEI